MKEAAAQYTTIHGAFRRRPYRVSDDRHQDHAYVIARTPQEAVEIFFRLHLSGGVHLVEMYDQADPRPDMKLQIALLEQKIKETDLIISNLPDVEDEKFAAFRSQLYKTLDDAKLECDSLVSRYRMLSGLTTDQAIRENVRLLALEKQSKL